MLTFYTIGNRDAPIDSEAVKLHKLYNSVVDVPCCDKDSQLGRGLFELLGLGQFESAAAKTTGMVMVPVTRLKLFTTPVGTSQADAL